MRVFFRDNSLSVAFLVLFLLTLCGQALAGHADHNEELTEHGAAPIGLVAYVTSSSFVVDVAENWQSEFLQFFLFILGTIWLVQRGSPESKQPGDAGVGTDADQAVGAHARPDSPRWARVRGVRLWLYSNSLLVVMGAIFLASWTVQSLAGFSAAAELDALHGAAPETWGEYVASPEFWNRTLQNWQSELLAVGAMVTFSIFLRQRGSSESKPVGAPHAQTAVESE